MQKLNRWADGLVTNDHDIFSTWYLSLGERKYTPILKIDNERILY